VREVPGLKVTYDNGNAAGGEDPAESFRKCAAHVAHAHFKDWDIRDTLADGYRAMLDGRYGKAALIGEGSVNQKACLAAMRAAGYQGCINLEYEGNVYTPAEACRRAAAYLRGLGEGVV
jgi:sugar phosphate isomerase/epimerase